MRHKARSRRKSRSALLALPGSRRPESPVRFRIISCITSATQGSVSRVLKVRRVRRS